MTYTIMRLIDLMKDQFPILLNTVLERIPVMIVGEDLELVDDITESLTSLAPHRKRLVFWRDFTSETEIQSVWEEERHNYDVNRTVVCSLSSNLRLALDRISHFTGWLVAIPLGSTVLGVTVDEQTLNEVTGHILKNSPNCGIIRVTSPSTMTFSLLAPANKTLVVEKKIVEKILVRKKQSLERIRRLLRKSLRSLNVSECILEAVLKLDDESEKLTQDVFEEEINNYVHAARRAVTLLSRIRLARELGASTTLTERNLYEAIGWDAGELVDLIRFIDSEWHEDFSDCVRSGTLSGLGAWVDSMWGA
ncbi:MAG: hypothetical protein ACTSV3_01125 [Candidatus Thorarchaeota archaeon]|nr:MAG: hypothetical protein DRO73_11590 [Candidatus Thorarchaeota archaeon]RLI57049.1 MAG: hypothetical protein DRP09_04715 [Candidatus Thorarchaeota archaeon]